MGNEGLIHHSMAVQESTNPDKTSEGERPPHMFTLTLELGHDMYDDHYPTFPIRNDIVALLMGFAQGDHPYQLNEEYMVESI
ncbi:hypothetical protein Pyn_23436 [Prunus yedoensis var. nudiflora]|uniref:Uncharacterized protein n=1 Tax=Prunus yedoensis var. nudiflora TaxID=2094558 RepID=A0A314XJ95_PRUYE|nr:hypothetical protein Pyn_23436 [Prunus yedoensis var. nudiflora]